MTLIAIELPLAYSTANALKRANDQLDGIRAGLSSQWTHLSANWEGHDKYPVEGWVRSNLGALNRMSDRIHDLGVNLEMTARRFEEADELSGQPMRNLAVAASALVSGGTGITSAVAAALPKEQVSEFGRLLEKYKAKPLAKKPKKVYINQYPPRAPDNTFLAGQERNDSCAIASTRMVLKQVTGKDYKESDLRELSHKIPGGYRTDRAKWGTSPNTLATLINNHYAESASAVSAGPGTQSIGDLEAAVKDGKGIIVSVRLSEWLGGSKAHSVTVVGVATENGQQMVYVNDPWPPNQGKKLAIPAGDFTRAWYGDATYVSRKQ